MIGVALEFTGESKRLLARLERETPRTFRKALAGAATHAQNQLRKLMRIKGGDYGVPKFAERHELTGMLWPGRKFGGVLAEKDQIKKWKKGDGWVVGWVDRLSEWASAHQGSLRYEFAPWQKSYFHRKAGARLKGYKIPAYYSRPARPVIDPFADRLSREFPGMVIEMYNKAVKRRQKKGQVIR